MPSNYYINTARTGKATNLYQPDEDSDKFEWNENDFIYNCTRDKLNGTNKDAKNLFNVILKEIENEI
jgi:thymidylate synthase (FAD)